MPSLLVFNLPDVGEGLTEAQIVNWHVKVNQNVKINDIIVEIETAKSIVDLPSPCSGTVMHILVKNNTKIHIGDPIISFLINNKQTIKQYKKNNNYESLKFYETKEQYLSDHFCNHSSEMFSVLNFSNNKLNYLKPIIQNYINNLRKKYKERNIDYNQEQFKSFLAKPPVRQYAKRRLINLNNIKPSGLKNYITKNDVINYLNSSKNNQYDKIHISNVRRLTAESVTKSALTIPHASLFIEIDISNTIQYLDKLKSSSKFNNIKLTPFLILAYSVVQSIKKNPIINSSWKTTYIKVKKFINLGIAVATKRGLLVPNIKNADRLSLFDLAIQLNHIVQQTRLGKIKPDLMTNGSITLTNLGTLGVDYGIPIINPGETSIISFGIIRSQPWIEKEDKIVIKKVLKIGGSFDHRIIDGDLAAKFLLDIKKFLIYPHLMETNNLN